MSDIKLPEYHQSSIAMFLKCPRQYMYRYLMGYVLPPKAALTLGKSVDVAVTANLNQKVNTQIDLPESEVLDAYSSCFDKEAPATSWDGEDSGKVKDQGIKMLKVYHRDAAPTIQPKTVQDAFRLETDEGYALGGTLDLTDKDEYIRDTKTSKAEYSPDAVNDSLQATMYDFAHEAKTGKKAKGFIFDVITKHKEPRYQKVVGEVGPGQRERMFESIRLMHKSIERGEFQYAPEGQWFCSKDWCGYWSQCKGKK